MSARNVIKTITMNIPNGGSFSVQIWRQEVERQQKGHTCVICKHYHDESCLLLGITYVYPDEVSEGPQFSACPGDHDTAEANWSQFHSKFLASYKFDTENAAHQFMNLNLAAAGFTHEHIELPSDDSENED